MLRWLLVDGRLELGPDGRLLVVRPPLPGEADRLRALAGLVVPDLVDERDGELLLTWSPPADDVVAVAADVAAVLAAAHRRHVTHGPLVPEHVRTGGVVDGWAGGTAADDVAAFGRLLLDAGPVPEAVAALARRAVADDPAVRPTMAAVAEALAPPPVAPAPPRRERRLHVPRWAPAAAAVPVALAALLATAGDADPTVVAVEVRCDEVETTAELDPATGSLRLDDGQVLADAPPGCDVVVRP
jgi:hypothetical protein